MNFKERNTLSIISERNMNKDPLLHTGHIHFQEIKLKI